MTYTSEKNRGITLVECVIVLFIVGMITLFICTFFITQTKHYNREEQITKMQQDLRTGLMMMVKDIREAGFEGVNLDLIYGLPLQTNESFLENIRKAVEIKPDRLVTFSYAHVPWVKSKQKILEELGLPGPTVKLDMLLKFAFSI